MKVAIVYNRISQKVINLFGLPNREKYGLKSIKRISDALKKGGHQVIALEGDKDLVDNLEDFMPRVLKGELPGMVFNLSYGIQGQARYTHVPGILEMVGIPYVGSGPLAHSLALDKVVAKMIFKQNNISTPDFAVLDGPGFIMPEELSFPLIVKPKNEAVSFGIKIVNTEQELRDAAGVIFDQFQQPVLAEQYIAGREINVGLLGNNPPEAFAPAELTFGQGGPDIYTYEDKTRNSGREIGVICPAPLAEEQANQAKELAIRAFNALGCYDCARVDMRLDDDGNFYILEINSLPSLGEHGSYVAAAEAMGMDFAALVNRLVEVTSARYFGTPVVQKVDIKGVDPAAQVFSFLTQHRDTIEKRIQYWCNHTNRTPDMVGRQMVVNDLERRLGEIKMKPVADLTSQKVVWTWQTKAGLKNGTLFLIHIDVPSEPNSQIQRFRRDPEWFYGEGIGSTWAPLTILEFVFRALRSCRKLQRLPIGILCYGDEGFDCRYSSDIIQKACAQAKRVFVMRPGNPGGKVMSVRRGQRKYSLIVDGNPVRLGKVTKRPEILRWAAAKVDQLASLNSRKDRLAISALDFKCDSFPMLLPHRVTITLLTSFPSKTAADRLEKEIRELLGTKGPRWHLELISDRPPMRSRKMNKNLYNQLSALADEWEIPIGHDSSVWPSVAGLVPDSVPVLCGMGPTVRDLNTGQEAVERMSVMQKTLLLAQFLVSQLPQRK